MAVFDSDGVEISYDAMGRGDPVLLIHGFAANRGQAWRAAGWYDAFFDAMREVVALDLRGHGQSEKLYEPEAYRMADFSGDVIRLMDRLEIEKADMIGHSMGSGIGAFLLTRHPERVKSLVMLGSGGNMIEGRRRERNVMADAMRAPNPMEIEEERARSFRIFAGETGADLEALAICTTAERERITADDFKNVTAPVLILQASQDAKSDDPEKLAQAVPGAKAMVIPRTTHHSILMEHATQDAVFRFLGLPPPQHGHQW